MHVQKTDLSTTKVQLLISAEETTLQPIKNQILSKLAAGVKLPGFREGTAPPALIEKNIDQSKLQSEFLDEAMTQLYSRAANQERIRPVTRPEVAVKKFVPFTELEFEVTTEVVSAVKLPDYKKITAAKDSVSVAAKDVDDVITSLKVRLAEKNDVTRAAKSGDQAWIDFKGVDAKGEPVNGADGKDYPLMLGSNTFIPGFEDNVIGMMPGDEKSFTLKFPKDYGVKALASKDVTFTAIVTKVQEVVEAKVDDAFAAKVGPFKSVAELKADIKKQLTFEKQRDADMRHQDAVIRAVVDKTKVDIPEVLIEQQVVYIIDELKRNLTYRGQTYQEFLKAEGLTEEEYKKQQAEPQAVNQIKTSLVLSEIAERENLIVTPEELEIRIQMLKGQYQDPAMQGELDKPESRRDVAGRMLSEKVLELLANPKS